MNTFPSGAQASFNKLKVTITEKKSVEREVELPIATKGKYGGYFFRNDTHLMIVRDQSISLWEFGDKYTDDYLAEMATCEPVPVQEVKDAIAATVNKFLNI